MSETKLGCNMVKSIKNSLDHLNTSSTISYNIRTEKWIVESCTV